MSVRLVTACALVLAVIALAFGVYGCGQGQTASTTTSGPATTQSVSTTQPASTTSESASTTSTTKKPLDSITLPDNIPGYTEVDPATGLHVTGTPQQIDATTWRLNVTGKVDKPLSLTYDEILSLPTETATPTLVCPGYFKDTATWTGVPVHVILEMAGVQPDAKSMVMKAADGYATTVSLDDALQPQSFLAYQLEGNTLPALHGYPIRAVFPDLYGSTWVKWLTDIEIR